MILSQTGNSASIANDIVKILYDGLGELIIKSDSQ
jgi:hypothetical protein